MVFDFMDAERQFTKDLVSDPKASRNWLVKPPAGDWQPLGNNYVRFVPGNLYRRIHVPHHVVPDQFGVADSLLDAISKHCDRNKQSGRTTMLLKSLVPGARLVVRPREVLVYQNLLREMNVDGVDVVGVPTDNPYELRGSSTSVDKTVFEHTWVEAYFQERIKSALAHLEELGVHLSGWSNAHEKTRDTAEQLASLRLNNENSR